MSGLEEALDDLAFDEAVEIAADAQSDEGVDVGAARERAREIVDQVRTDGDSGSLAGLQDMHNLSLAIGLPVPRILFSQIVNAANAPENRKKVWRREIKGMSDLTETGCIKVDFRNQSTGEDDTVYLVFDECQEDHDLGAQLEKIYSVIPESKQDDIRKHLSTLVLLGRSAYGQMIIKMAPLLEKIKKKMPDEFEPRRLCIDAKNTTIFLPEVDTSRVGIFVRFESEVGQNKL